MVINNPVINYHFFRAVDKAARSRLPALTRSTRACRPAMSAVEFKQRLFEMQAAIDEAAEGATLSGGSHLRLCAANKALHDAWEFELSKHVRQANIERFASLVNEAESVARSWEDKLAALRLPKPAKTPLMCFKDQHIPAFAGNNPDLSVEEIQQLLAKAYEQLSEEGKAPYLDAAAASRLRHAETWNKHSAAVREHQRAQDVLRAFRRQLQNEW